METHLKNNEAPPEYESNNWAALLEIEREKQRREEYGERPMLEIPRAPPEKTSETERSPAQGGSVEIITI